LEDLPSVQQETDAVGRPFKPLIEATQGVLIPALTSKAQAFLVPCSEAAGFGLGYRVEALVTCFMFLVLQVRVTLVVEIGEICAQSRRRLTVFMARSDAINRRGNGGGICLGDGDNFFGAGCFDNDIVHFCSFI
jgi:hypothetical protein